MGDGRMVIRQRVVENEDRPPKPGRLEDTIYVGQDQMAVISRDRILVDGKLIETKPHAMVEPVGTTYDVLIGRVLWPLGRRFSHRIDQITEVSEEADGTLAIEIDRDQGELRWEMRIDPQADYLVRSAKAYRRDHVRPSYIVESAGVFASENRYIAHTARWTEGPSAHPFSISVTSVSAGTDQALIDQTEKLLEETPPRQKTTITRCPSTLMEPVYRVSRMDPAETLLRW